MRTTAATQRSSPLRLSSPLWATILPTTSRPPRRCRRSGMREWPSSAARADTGVTAPRAGRPSRWRSLRRISCIGCRSGIRACCRVSDRGGRRLDIPRPIYLGFMFSTSEIGGLVGSGSAPRKPGDVVAVLATDGLVDYGVPPGGGLDDVVAACTERTPRSGGCCTQARRARTSPGCPRRDQRGRQRGLGTVIPLSGTAACAV